MNSMSLDPQAQALLLKKADAVVALAREVGALLRDAPEAFRTVHASEGSDIKIEADQACERHIRAVLGPLTQLPIYGEEQGGDIQLTQGQELYWLVDPLDGTYNYVRALPLYCVSIGLFRGMQPIWGVVYDPDRDECFSGGPGYGLTLNGQAVSDPSWASSRKDACLLTGFPNAVDFSDAALDRFFDAVKGFKKTRMLGTAALALAHISIGRAEAYYEENIRLWDIAAGLALVHAVGGQSELVASTQLPLCYRARIGAPIWNR